MDIRIENELGRRIPREHVIARLAQALRRLPVRATARVTFTDVNGPKGGPDVRCTVLVRLPGQPPVSVARAGTTPRLAFDTSYDRAIRQLERGRARWQDSRRHPKKYYVAKRLLTTALAVAVLAVPLVAFAQAPPPGDLELKTKKKTTVVTPKPGTAEATKDAEAVTRTTEGARRVGEANKRELPSRADRDVTGGIQSKGIKGEITK